ncbi:MAG: hypothetical protein H6741_01090 [Alphaproteobacteria bacterium]|nr:hypothetical protein [Alphaproteobacteria bacterium]MCB9791294.1 hypothetical protein [Alphaproteobacteria bacterium]
MNLRDLLRRLRWLAEELLPPVLLYTLAMGVMTWPAILHVDEVIIGGGELGGWLWRYWWHFMEMEALGDGQLGFFERILTFLSLGRYPETGNILDVLLLSYPLQAVFGLPAHYNLKIFILLMGNGLCGYALGRSLTRHRSAALAAGLMAVVNPLTIQDIHGSGLRQVMLWWVLLFPVALFRAEDQQTPRAGVLAGVLLGLCGAFYWFYGLFAGILFGMWLLRLLWVRRAMPMIGQLVRWVGPLLVATAAVGGTFALPYILGEGSGTTVGQGGQLPELSFFLPFPEYDVIRDVPLRPSNYEENVLSSLNRTIMSSWSADYLFNPGHPRALPIGVLLFGVLPALLMRPGPQTRGRFWILVFAVFYLGTLGPFLKLGGDLDNAEVLILADSYVVRMPWTWMFRWIPGMSRMFGPYRMGALVVVAAVALMAIGLSRLPGGAWTRRLAALAVMASTLLQITYRWEIGPVPEGAMAPTMWRPPLKVSALFVPDYYGENLDPDVLAGVIELPLEQQQDLLYFYQLNHKHKVYKGWATPPAVPPAFREEGRGGKAGARMRYLAAQDRYGAATGELLMALSRQPTEVDLDKLSMQDLSELLVSGGYTKLLIHERGYFLVDPQNGATLYRDVVRRLEAKLGLPAEEVQEIAWMDYPGNQYEVPDGPVYIPWSSNEVPLPDQDMPKRYFMSIFDLQPLIDSFEGPLPELDAPDAPPGPQNAHEHGDGVNPDAPPQPEDPEAAEKATREHHEAAPGEPQRTD